MLLATCLILGKHLGYVSVVRIPRVNRHTRATGRWRRSWGLYITPRERELRDYLEVNLFMGWAQRGQSFIVFQLSVTPGNQAIDREAARLGPGMLC